MSSSPPSQTQSTPPSPPTGIPTPNPHPHPTIIQSLSYSPLKKPQPIPWSHEETLNLIQAYQEKWYSLKRGQLKASQWEEVAITVAARCGLDEPSKSATQCRHKIEKLRKRYRAEKLKLPPSFNYNNHPWIYFSLMDQLEKGPLPISAVPPPPHHKNNDPVSNSDDDCDVGFSNLRGFDKRVDGFSRTGRNLGDFRNGSGKINDFRKRMRFSEMEEEEEDMGDEIGEDLEEDMEKKGRKDDDLMGDLATQMRDFAERFVKMEGKKIELMRETEKLRMEMENKRMEMILISQQKTVELISKVFNGSSQKKMKMTSEL
ncbi:unnamed protein product [Amaranthus hypochondriacus]